jgi:hypothetical protein
MIARLRRVVGVAVIFSLGVGLGLWLNRSPKLTPEQACLLHIRAITMPKSPAWQQ